MKNFSYCEIHSTFPKIGEPCWACIKEFGDKKLEAELKSANDGVEHGNEVIEDLIEKNDKLQAENAKLKSKKYITLTQAREYALFTLERRRERQKWQETQDENANLKILLEASQAKVTYIYPGCSHSKADRVKAVTIGGLCPHCMLERIHHLIQLLENKSINPPAEENNDS